MLRMDIGCSEPSDHWLEVYLPCWYVLTSLSHSPFLVSTNYPGSFPTHIDGLNRRESASMLQWFHDLITYGHDLQVRLKWNEPNDIGMWISKLQILSMILTIEAIWDNRCVFHTATGDHEGFGPRNGNRAVGIGEIPRFDPASKSRREDLGMEDTLAPCHL